MLHTVIDYKGQRHFQTFDLREIANWVVPNGTITVTICSRVIPDEPKAPPPAPLVLNFD
jgi:hypothetical protein